MIAQQNGCTDDHIGVSSPFHPSRFRKGIVMAEPVSLPDFLTIEEAARVLRLGRTAAYEQARVWRETDGKVGLPNFMIGHAVRVPTAALEKMLGRPLSAIPTPRGAPAPAQVRPDGREDGQVNQLRPRRSSRTSRPDGGAQGALPL
jgi:hypothetical protein